MIAISFHWPESYQSFRMTMESLLSFSRLYKIDHLALIQRCVCECMCVCVCVCVCAAAAYVYVPYQFVNI